MKLKTFHCVICDANEESLMQYTLYISPSMLRRVATCHTRAALASLGFSGGEAAPQLGVGKAIHVGLATHLDGKPMGSIAMQTAYGDAVSRGELGDLNDLDPEYELSNVRGIFEEWIERNKQLPFTVSKVEVPFNVEFCTLVLGEDTVKVRIIGVLDALAAEDTNIVLVEHKTTRKRIDARYRRLFRTDPQLGAYLFAATKLLGVPIMGVWVNAIGITKLPDSDRKCREHGLKYAECGKLHAKMAMFKVDRTSEQLCDWANEARELCAEYFAICKRQESYYHGTNPPCLEHKECLAEDIQIERTQGAFNGGCEYCDYADFCAGGRTNLGALGRYESEEGTLRSRLVLD